MIPLTVGLSGLRECAAAPVSPSQRPLHILCGKTIAVELALQLFPIAVSNAQVGTHQAAPLRHAAALQPQQWARGRTAVGGPDRQAQYKALAGRQPDTTLC